MPRVYNTSGAQPGSIYRITLVNFVTYKEVELYPGPCLNMIIGPNGSGKSTFVSAMILGLCGKIQSIRGSHEKNTDLSSYIRTGCSEAIIEIELYQEYKKENVIITRVINRNNTSKWTINKVVSNQTAVKNLINRFNIQVDNLCQMLPQHRVKDFAQMSLHDRLISTLQAVGENRRLKQLEEFKNINNTHRNIFDELKKKEQRKQELIKQNESLKLKIEILNQRKQLDREIKVCECKKLWIEEALLRDKCEEYQNQKKAAEKIVKSHGSKVKPLEDSMEHVNREIDQLEKDILETTKEIDTYKDQIADQLQCVKLQKDKIEEAHKWYLDFKKREEYNKKELAAAKTKLDKLQNDRSDKLQKYGDDNRLRVDLENYNIQINTLSREIMSLTSEKDDIQSSVNRTTAEIQRCRDNIEKLESVDVKRMRMLEARSPHAAGALRWLRDNRQRFRGDVCGPIVLEIQLHSARHARYLEGAVGARDLFAFCFSHADDMNLFLRLTRQEMGLKQVNAVCSPQEQDTTAPDIAPIRHLGFEIYLVDTFTAPEMVVKFLCRNYNLHRIPVGNEHTYHNSNRVPENIRLFFSENHRFSVRVSAYSRERSTLAAALQPAALLADTRDGEQIARWHTRLSKCEEKQQEDTRNKQIKENNISISENRLNELDTKRKEIKKRIQLIQQLAVNIMSEQKNVERLENRTPVDLTEERRKCVDKQREYVDKQLRLHADMLDVLRALHRRVANNTYAKTKLRLIRNSIGAQQAKLRELINNLKKAQNESERVSQLERGARVKAREKKEAALRASGGLEPHDARFPERALYAALPGDAAALRAHGDELAARAGLLSRSDDQDLETFKENERLIDKLTEEINSRANACRGLNDKINREKNEWLSYVRSLLADINVRFSELFAKVGCAGEVQLATGAVEEDFSSYGLAVMVKFRDDQPLSLLTEHTQSGGERALSIALYLLALQRHHAAPFRCVDEINQGMDATNERNMFNLLVKETTEAERGQYFLLTPNLLPNLEYKPNIMVHTIMNGKQVMNYDQWNIDSFIEKMRSYRPAQR